MEVRSIEAIVRALNDAGVQYLIVGGLPTASRLQLPPVLSHG
jgi:hypothetical protein